MASSASLPIKVGAHLLGPVLRSPNREFSDVGSRDFKFPKEEFVFGRLFDVAQDTFGSGKILDYTGIYQLFHDPEDPHDDADLVWRYMDWVRRNAEALMPLFEGAGPASLKEQVLNGLLDARSANLTAEEKMGSVGLANDAREFIRQFNEAWEDGTLRHAVFKAMLVNLTNVYAHSSLCDDESLPDRLMRNFLDNEPASVQFEGEALGGLAYEKRHFFPRVFAEIPGFFSACRDDEAYRETLRSRVGRNLLGARFEGGYHYSDDKSLEELVLHLEDPADIIKVFDLIDFNELDFNELDFDKMLGGIPKDQLNSVVDRLLKKLDSTNAKHTDFIKRMITAIDTGMAAKEGRIYDRFKPRGLGIGAPRLPNGVYVSKTLKLARDRLVGASKVAAVTMPSAVTAASAAEFAGSVEVGVSDLDETASLSVGEDEDGHSAGGRSIGVYEGAEASPEADEVAEEIISKSKACLRELKHAFSTAVGMDEDERRDIFVTFKYGSRV